ncbi:transporter substrate-binding domain-containing protein [uncultured Pseudodesulfovibrio sp.]|uniref:transporter substrate-binding domain-containing protein n=1 Tax=uncultured Pseudodesulfovibrio sp. TaxID=2035858 RepID=UPI0029C736DE|nr:transporter substrate-binding domain-containing protein [uncultured Pseudodesulfovibrio sp.]
MRWSDQLLVAVCFLVFLLAPVAASAEETLLDCGMAKGYPPYQFLDEEGEPAGLDIEVARLLFSRLKVRYRLAPGAWDDVVANLRLGRLDCVCGMEINHARRSFFDFTKPYYNRKVVIFLPRDDASIQSVGDLVGKAVAGDRHSFVEEYLKDHGLLSLIRIVKTKSKEQSMRMLKEGKVVAVIAPLAVGRFLADRDGLDLRIMDVGDPGSPVGLAVEKGNADLLRDLDTAMQALRQEGKLQTVLGHWLH